MSKRKKITDKQINNTRMIPLIIGAVVIFVLMMFSFSKVREVYVNGNLDSKIYTAYFQNIALLNYVKDNNTFLETDNTEKNEIAKGIIEQCYSINDFYITDKDGNVLYSYSGTIPDHNLEVTVGTNKLATIEAPNLAKAIDEPLTKYFNAFFGDEIDFGVYTEYDEDAMNELSEKMDAYMEENYDSLAATKIEVDDQFFLDNQIFFELPLWLKYEVGENNLYFNSNVNITFLELAYVGAVVLLLIGISLLFVVYYAITLIVFFRDRKRLMQVYYTDAITGGNNWKYLNKYGKKYIKRAKDRYAVINLRVNKYRNYCTCYGVKSGEYLLERVSEALDLKMRKREIAAHYEKADFAVLVKYTTDGELESRVNEFIDAISKRIPEVKINMSVGICVLPEVVDKNTELKAYYNYAGVALATIDVENERRIAWYSEEMKSNQLWESKVESEMERALKNKEFQVYLQPKYSTSEEKLAAAEALVRWLHPEDGLIPPGKFIPIFEKNGFILELDDYMISEVARLQAKWKAEGKQLFPISVNVSRAHFTRDDLAEHIRDLIAQYDVPFDCIELELTESAFFDDKEVLLGTLIKLKEYGFLISMDDFGAGYSSLNSLKELPLDVVKLDAEFFRGQDNFGKGKLIVEETINLAKRLDMRIVAEGIETREQVDFLAEQKCDLIQGYYFAKPLPVNEFEARAYA